MDTFDTAVQRAEITLYNCEQAYKAMLAVGCQSVDALAHFQSEVFQLRLAVKDLKKARAGVHSREWAAKLSNTGQVLHTDLWKAVIEGAQRRL